MRGDGGKNTKEGVKMLEKSTCKLRQVLFDIQAGNSNLARSLGEKVAMQCTKMKTHTDACYPCKINKTNHFSLILVTFSNSDHRDLFSKSNWRSTGNIVEFTWNLRAITLQ